jgi:hypothetical protein
MLSGPAPNASLDPGVMKSFGHRSGRHRGRGHQRSLTHLCYNCNKDVSSRLEQWPCRTACKSCSHEPLRSSRPLGAVRVIEDCEGLYP